MQPHEFLLMLPPIIYGLFVFAFGACVGSLTNVIVYRMPRGISIVWPSSRCPRCETKLGWRDNIPVFGWIMLRGRCRYCRTRISPEYPIVEGSVGLLFVVFYLLWYVVPPGATVLGVQIGAIRPEWFLNSAGVTWPTFALLLALLGSLVAMTIVDARTYTIPLVLTWAPAVVALVLHPLHALVIELRMNWPPRTAPGYLWAIPTPGLADWGAIGAATGGILGLGISNLLLWLGLIRPSFADYAEWERTVLEQPGEAKEGEKRAAVELAAMDDPVVAGGTVQRKGKLEEDAARGSAGDNPPGGDDAASVEGQPADLWIQYPHARREMLKELAFLAPAALLAMAGWYAARMLGGVSFDPWQGVDVAAMQAPLWLSVLGGVLIGYLVGGGIVWGVRILGSLGFGKEAMGLGDVHLMAAVGACLGWIDATLAFFGAAFVGIAWAILGRAFSGVFQRAMPYGPFLAIATVLVLLTKPAIESGLSLLFQQPVNLP